LKIVDDKIYVLGRDQITRLHDLNGDNEADFYECFYPLDSISPSYHAFVFDLQTDSAGNFYYSSCGNQIDLNLLPKHGCITKVSKDGMKSEVICNGLRAPNGLCISPRDENHLQRQSGLLDLHKQNQLDQTRRVLRPHRRPAQRPEKNSDAATVVRTTDGLDSRQRRQFKRRAGLGHQR